MRLLTYTKYLWRKIKFYDKLVCSDNSFLINPFDDKDRSVTIVWIEDNSDETDTFLWYDLEEEHKGVIWNWINILSTHY